MAGSMNSWETDGFPILKITSIIRSTISSGVLRENWSSLARTLGFTSDSIKKIRSELQLNTITLSDAIHEIIEDWHERCRSGATVQKLIKAFEDLNMNTVGEKLRLEFNLPCTGSENPSLSWDEIGEEFQRKVESSLAEFYPSIQFDNESKTKLAGEVLVELMTRRKPSPIKNIIPEALKYYVPRTLITRNVLTEKIFEPSSDTFLFTGIERNILSSKAGRQRTDTTSNQLNHRDPDVRYMVLDMPSYHFSKFQASSTSAVHLINFEDGKFYWVKTNGSLRDIRWFVDKSQGEISEGDFLRRICSSSMSNIPVCISDSPGMGKSEILKEIARNIAKELPGRFVVFQEFPKFVDLVVQQHNKVASDLKTSIQIALQELTCKNELEVQILNSKLKAGTATVELLLDGYDELSAASVQMADIILKEIHSSLSSIRLWVTTRRHLLEDLEDILTVLGYTIQFFTTDNQIMFLTSYWARQQNLPLDRLTEYATNCLAQLKSTLSSKEEDIARIPLQCYMIGEVYEEEARDYSRSQAEFISVKIRITTITELYKLMVEKKLQKYQFTYEKEKLSEKVLKNMHIQLALRLLFPEYFEKVKSKLGEVRKDDLLNIGILESKGTEAELIFIHRTFAEYFVALLFVNVLNGEYIQDGVGDNSCNHAKLLFSDIFMCRQPPKKRIQKPLSIGPIRIVMFMDQQSQYLYEFKYHVICFFINSLLSGKTVHPNVSQSLGEMGNDAVVMNQIAWGCVAGNHINIFNLFDGLNLFDKDVFSKEFTLETIKMASVDIAKRTIDGFERLHNMDSDFPGEALRQAARRGEYSMVEFVFNEKRFQTIMNDPKKSGEMEILHCCVQDSYYDSNKIIQQKLEVIEFLFNKNNLMLEEKNIEGVTPLLCNHVHTDLLVKLIGLGSNVFAIDSDGSTILHRTLLFSKVYYSILIAMDKEDLAVLANVEGGEGQYPPLISVIHEMDEIDEEIFDVFKEAEADFNVCDKVTSYPLLAIAIEWHRDKTILRKLVECGSDVNWRGNDGRNLLHVATQNCNLDAVHVLLDNKVDINAVDNTLDTPLHDLRTPSRKIDDFLKIIKAILESGGNAAALNSKGNTFLHAILKNNGYRNITAAQFHDIVQLLIQLKCAYILQVENADGQSSLMAALQYVDVDKETLSLLRDNGVNLLKSAEVVRRNGANRASPENHYVADYNLLHVACQYGRYKLIPFLLRIGLHVNAGDSSGMTPLHCAVHGLLEADDDDDDDEDDHDDDDDDEDDDDYDDVDPKVCWKTIKVLIENRADINSTIDGQTFLHIILREFYNLNETFDIFWEFLVKNDCIKLFDTQGKGGVTPLHYAVQLKDVSEETISFLHENGVKFDSVDNNGDSVLVCAIYAYKSVDFIGNVIRCGANAKQTNNKGQTLLHIATMCHNADVIEFIVNLGMDVNSVDINGNTPLHLCLKYGSSHLSASSSRQVSASLIRNGGSVTTFNNEGQSSFSLAKQKCQGDEKLLQLFYDRLAGEKDKLDGNGNTALHIAVYYRDCVLINELVRIGANKNAPNKKLQTPLHIASLIADKDESMKIIKFLISNNADPAKKDGNDCTFLHILLAQNNSLSPANFHSVTDCLISKGHVMSLETPGWNNGTAPIHLALFNLNADCRTISLLSSHVNWNLADHQGRTPLFFAARKGDSLLLALLVQLGADHLHFDNLGNSVLHIAAEYGNTDGLKYFISVGLNVNDKNSYGNTPLHVAVLLGQENVTEMVNILVAAGANANLRNNVDQTPLLILAQKF